MAAQMVPTETVIFNTQECDGGGQETRASEQRQHACIVGSLNPETS